MEFDTAIWEEGKWWYDSSWGLSVRELVDASNICLGNGVVLIPLVFLPRRHR